MDSTHYVYFLLDQHKHWEWWAKEKVNGWNKPEALRTSIPVKDLVVDVVYKKKDEREDEYGDGYGSGSEAESYLILKVTFPDSSVQHYRKRGVYDSYGRENWFGKFESVEPQVETITVYKYVP